MFVAAANVQDDLIGALLRAALVEAGAQRGLLILSPDGEHRIAAEDRAGTPAACKWLGNDESFA
ncbi:MAG: hypothetical protein WBQ02_13365 [Terracidiphilus sp.]